MSVIDDSGDKKQKEEKKWFQIADRTREGNIPEEKPETVQTYSWKGLTLKEVSTEGERSATGLDKIRGILVVQVEKGITALQANDVILRINGKQVDNRTDMETEIRKSPEGNKFRIIFFRNQKENAVTM